MKVAVTPDILKYKAKENTPSTLSLASCDMSDANSEDGNSSSTPAEAAELMQQSPVWHFVQQTAVLPISDPSPPLSKILPPEDMVMLCPGATGLGMHLSPPLPFTNHEPLPVIMEQQQQPPPPPGQQQQQQQQQQPPPPPGQ